VSCIDLDKTPVAPFTHIPLAALWTKYIERKISYIQEQVILDIPEYISISGEIYSQNWELNRVSFKTAYANAIPPVDLWIEINLMDRKITEIDFVECKLLLNSLEYDLLNIPNENIQASEFTNSYDERSFSARKYEGEFEQSHKFIINNSSVNYFSGFSLGLKSLLFNCYENEKIIIKYGFIIKDKENNNKEYNSEILYKRKFEEKTGADDNGEIWTEINFEEWKKYIK
jgi:hypothetical protein